jgi:YVTN family beta-propeller protein
MVVDTETGKSIGEIDYMKNIRNIALDDSGKYGYVTDVTDGSAGFVRVFDRTTLKLVTSIPTGAVPAAIVFDPLSKAVFVFNSRGHSATVIDTATNQVTATIPLAGRPSSAVGDGNGAVFVALPALGEITRIDAAAKKVTASWQLAPCTGPSGLAIDRTRHPDRRRPRPRRRYRLRRQTQPAFPGRSRRLAPDLSPRRPTQILQTPTGKDRIRRQNHDRQSERLQSLPRHLKVREKL